MSYFQNRGTVFIFNPSGGQSPAENFYNTWVDMMADIAGVPGEKTICLDNNGTLIGSSIVPTGTYDLDKITLAGPMARVQTWAIQNDVIFENFRHMARNLTIDYEGTSQPLCTLSESITTNITVEDRCAAISSGGASQPVWQLTGSIAYNFHLLGASRLGSFATTQDTVKTAGAAVVLNLKLDGQSNIPDAQTLEGDGTDTLNVTFLDALSTAQDFSAEGFGTYTVTSAIYYDGGTENVGIGGDPGASFKLDVLGSNIRIINSADLSAGLFIDSGTTTGQTSRIVYRDQGVSKWEVAKNNDNHFCILDHAELHDVVTIETHADNADSIHISGGNVGIHTVPDPSYDFHVLGTNMLLESETNLGLTLEGATGAASSLNFMQNGTNHWVLRSDGASNFVLKNGSNDNIIGVINGVTTEAIRIDSAGEVGINNIAPNRQLDVTGTGRFSGLLDADGGIEINGVSISTGGGYELIETVAISNQATVDITLTPGYVRYVVQMNDIVPATDDSELWMRFSLVGTPTTFLAGASDYYWRQDGWRVSGGNVSQTNDTADNQVQLSRSTAARKLGTGTGESFNATIYMPNPDQSTYMVFGTAITQMLDSGASQQFSEIDFGLVAVQAANIAAVRFLADSGNLSTGTISVYGLGN